MNRNKGFDPVLVTLATLATVVGLLAIYDSGYARAAADGMFVPREFRSQFVSALVALGAGFACSWLRRSQWKRLAWPFFGLVVAGLVAVKLGGTEINGATRWIDLKVMTVQPAEFAKLGVVLLLASALAGRKPAPKLPRPPRHWAERIDWVWVPRLARSWPLVLVLVAAGLVAFEPDLATAMVIVVVAGAMMVLGGVSRGSLVTLGLGGAMVVGLLVVKEPYRMDRILHHGDRWSAQNVDSIGYQTTQSEAAMAKGGWLGVGIGEGRAKHTLPAPTTDFVMTTVSEEFGLLGTVMVIGLMGGVTFRLVTLGRRSTDPFARLVLGGTATWIGVQACTNIVMCNGTAPPIGVPMPFISAGGSSLMALWMAVGVCQAALRQESRQEAVRETDRHRRWHRRSRVSRA